MSDSQYYWQPLSIIFKIKNKDSVFRLAISVTVERLVAVRFPLHTHVLLKRHRILIGIVGIYVLAVLSNLHFLLMLRAVPVAVCNSSIFTIGLEVVAEEMEPFGYNYSRYSITVSIISTQIIPLITLIILNSWLICSFKNQNATRKQRRSSLDDATVRKQDHHITIVVTAIISSFVLCNLPSTVIFAIHLSNGLETHMSKEFYIAAEISNILDTTGKALNVVVYNFCSEKFQKRIRLMFNFAKW